MTTRLIASILTLFLASLPLGMPVAADGPHIGPDKVVYHINDTEGQATRAMQYISNHLEVNPKARIVIVTHAAGVDFLMRGATTKNGNRPRPDSMRFYSPLYSFSYILLTSENQTTTHNAQHRRPRPHNP